MFLISSAALEKLHQHSEHYSRRQQYQHRQTSQQGGKFVFTFVFNGNECLPRGVQKRPLIFQPFTTLESIYGKLRQDFSYKLLAALLCLGVGPYAIMTPRFFSIFGYSFQHPRASAITDYRLRTQHSWTGNDRFTTFYFLLLAIPLAQAVCFFASMALHDREAGEFKIQGGSARKEGADEKERLAIAGDGVYWNCCLEPTVTWLAGNGKGAKKNKNWSEK